MLKKFTLLFLVLSVSFSSRLFGCDSSSCTLSREAAGAHSSGQHRVFADVSIEQMNWGTMDAGDAHRLHHQGHHVHNKTHEEITHFTVGGSPTDHLTVLAQIPYVVRGSIDIESHASLGRHEQSEGLGDLSLTGVWKFYQDPWKALGFMAGVKLPTGETNELNSSGLRFEPELQPGTGSTDALLGGVFQRAWGSWHARADARYLLKGKGDQDFQYGNTFISQAAVEREFNLNSSWEACWGLQSQWQVEQKQNESGRTVSDSGGTTVLLGPSAEIRSDGWTFFGNVLFPVEQNLGGVHQELDFVWSAGLKASW